MSDLEIIGALETAPEDTPLYIHRMIGRVANNSVAAIIQIYWGIIDDEIFIHGESIHYIKSNGTISRNVLPDGAIPTEKRREELKTYLLKHNIHTDE
jgi:hypothetical protein